MKIFNSLEEVNIQENTAIAVGNFDGVHKGHQELIRRTVATAKMDGLKSAVFTFDNHPRSFIGKENVKSILYREDKFRVIEEMGVDYLFNIPFTEDICTMDAIDYIDNLLVDKFRAKEIYCGFNYRFGYKAGGDVEVLMREGIKKEIGIHVLEPIRIEDQIVSSTLVRGLIEEGAVDEVSKFLGRYYSIGGEVVVGNKLGRTIGFPTVNLILDEGMASPSNGVYTTYCIFDGKKYPSITNVGVKPTVGDYSKNVETHIFNFDEMLYGKEIRVEFVKKTRDERKFENMEELSKQITQDCINAKAYHRQHGDL